MDEYGFAAAMKVGLQIFETTSRGTGRTTRLIERVQDGDQIICAEEKERRRLLQLLKDAGKNGVKVFAMSPDLSAINNRIIAAPGRTFFEHFWILQYMEKIIDCGCADLLYLQKVLSALYLERPGVDKSAERISSLLR